MSMFGDMGASCAAGEILTFIKRKIAENSKNPEIVKVLREIEKKAEEIKQSADAGWY